ncbi:hypothetical protein M595_5797 [Lyngbya aestuarii BL J]|uniref:Uncharacterized protein n=1 Tax=Lyngbya aestuarii BL J TaxID=1348334 RepID=U7QB34_9CYAN|nr:hypothetical protein M595_5797 [Lyngbya aestuarii BL J]
MIRLGKTATLNRVLQNQMRVLITQSTQGYEVKHNPTREEVSQLFQRLDQ